MRTPIDSSCSKLRKSTMLFWFVEPLHSSSYNALTLHLCSPHQQRAAGKFLFESSRKSKTTLPLSSVKSEEGKDTAEAMDIDSTQAGGGAEASGQEIEPSQLFPDVARHYRELREIFGEGLDTYITAEQPNAVPVP